MRGGLTVLRVSTVVAFSLIVTACDIVDPGGPQIAKPGIVHRPAQSQTIASGIGGIRIAPVSPQLRSAGAADLPPEADALLPDVTTPAVVDPAIQAMRERAEERARALERTFDEIKRRIDAEDGG